MSHPFAPAGDRPRWRWPSLWWTLPLLALAWLLEPSAEGLRLLGWTLPELCPYAALGSTCPGCGTTRAAVGLARGDLRAAWSFQPAVFLFVAALLAPSLPLAPDGGRRLATSLALGGGALALVSTFLR